MQNFFLENTAHIKGPPVRIFSTSVHAKNAEFERSVFENARVCFRLREFRRDLQDSRYLDVAPHGLRLKKIQVRSYF